MNIAPRWKKLIRDLEALGGRLALVVTAMVFGLVCVVSITSAYVTLTRDITSAYRDTLPASGILDVGAVSPDLLARVRAMEGVANAEPTTILHTRAEPANGRMFRGMLFVSQQPLENPIGKVRVEGTKEVTGPAVLVERRALSFAHLKMGDTISFDLPFKGPTRLSIKGSVFDPALAPADQEQAIYAYMDFKTWAALGGGAPEMIALRVSGDTADQAHVDRVVARVAELLRSEGTNVHLIQIPRAETHPHASQMSTVLVLFLAFAIVAWLLSAFLVSVTVEGLMQKQIRQIGIMKSIGARAGQIRGLYLAGVGALGAAALLICLPIGLSLGTMLAKAVAQLLNFDITSTTPPLMLLALWLATGLLTPVVFALLPLGRAAKMPVIKAIADEGINRPSKGQSRLLRALAQSGQSNVVARIAASGVLRNAKRSLLIIVLLGVAGAVTLTAQNIAQGYTSSVRIAAKERPFAADITLANTLSRQKAESLVLGQKGEAKPVLSYSVQAAPARPDGLAIVRTYPDGGHGSLTLQAFANTEPLSHLVQLKGELDQGFAQGIVLNQSAFALLGKPELGSTLRLSLDGEILALPLGAVVRQYMSPAMAFVSSQTLWQKTGQSGLNRLQIMKNDGSTTSASIVGIEEGAKALGTRVTSVITENLMDRAVNGHITILIVMLTAMGLMIAAVGYAGLTAAQGIAVAERRREFGILRALGARQRQIVASLAVEGVIFWGIALLLALVLSLPITAYLSAMIGRMTYGMALPFSIDTKALSIWAAASFLGALVASLPPGLAAARTNVLTSLNR